MYYTVFYCYWCIKPQPLYSICCYCFYDVELLAQCRTRFDLRVILLRDRLLTKPRQPKLFNTGPRILVRKQMQYLRLEFELIPVVFLNYLPFQVLLVHLVVFTNSSGCELRMHRLHSLQSKPHFRKESSWWVE